MQLKTVGSALVLAFTASTLVACAPAAQDAVQSNDTGIIGGDDATGEEPFAKSVALIYDMAQGSICTASILTNNLLLTAAHCVEGSPKNMIVVFGTSVENETLIKRPVSAYKVSPTWATQQGEDFNSGDIALVKFEGGLPEGYEAASVVTKIEAVKDGDEVLLAGYGNNDGAKGEGAGKLRHVKTTIKQVAFSESEILIEQSKGKGACHGDSGGPAYVEIEGKLAIIGVTSRGVNDPNNDCSVSAAYTSVPFYLNWLVKTAKELNKATPAPSVAPRNNVARAS